MRGAPSTARRRLVAVTAAWLVLGVCPGLVAHDIPTDLLVQAFVRPEGHTLRVLVRVPLSGLRDVEYPRRPGDFLELSRIDRALRDATALWLIPNLRFYENDAPVAAPRIVATRVSLPSDRSFGSYDQALAHVTGAPLANETQLFWNQSLLDALLEYPIRSDASEFSIEPTLRPLGIRVTTVLRFAPPSGAIRAFEFIGDPGLVRLDPRWHQAALRFVSLGFHHILDGFDHLLFLLCLVIPLRRFRVLVAVVTAFTIAHSITLLASAYGLAPDALWFPPLVETLIALSIVYMALENVVGFTVRRRWMITFGFGLVHGFGFSFALRESLQFAGSHLLASLLAFNVGVELGQLFVLLLLVPALGVLFRFFIAERLGTLILSAFVAHTGWHWMTERADTLRQFSFEWPVFDLAALATATRLLMLLLIVVGVGWLASGILRYGATRPAEHPSAIGPDD